MNRRFCYDDKDKIRFCCNIQRSAAVKDTVKKGMNAG